MYKKMQSVPQRTEMNDRQSDDASEAGSISSTIDTDWTGKLAERATEPYFDEVKNKGRFIVSSLRKAIAP